MHLVRRRSRISSHSLHVSFIADGGLAVSTARAEIHAARRCEVLKLTACQKDLFVHSIVMLSNQGSFVCPGLKHACNGLDSPSDPVPSGDRFAFPRALRQAFPESHRRDLQCIEYLLGRISLACHSLTLPVLTDSEGRNTYVYMLSCLGVATCKSSQRGIEF